MMLRTCWLALACTLGPLLAAATGPVGPEAVPRGEDLELQLGDGEPRVRRSAVRALARRGAPGDWELVIRALADPEAEVGDAAQLALGSLDDPGLVPLLIGRQGIRSGEERAALRAAEALGRVRATVDARPLAEWIGSVDGRAQRLMLWSVERLAARGLIEGDRDRLARSLNRLFRSRRDPELAADALLALAALGVEDLPRLASAARSSSEAPLRCAALRVSVERGLAEAEVWARGLAADRSVAVRLGAVDALESLATPGTLAALVRRLELEERERVRWHVLGALQRVSGRRYRFDPRPWKDWLESCGEDWFAAARERSVADASSAGGRGGASTRSQGLGELDVRGDRVCFLFDFSGSMWTELPGGGTPKQAVDLELRAALERLSDQVEFNLIPYANSPQPWRDQVARADGRNVRAALDFFAGCQIRGRGNVWDALMLALGDRSVDAIVVLTDGYPTGGVHADMDLIAPLFEHANRYRRVTLDAVLVDASHADARRWTELALGSGGRCLEVSLRSGSGAR